MFLQTSDQTFALTNQCITLFYVCLCFKTLYLIYIVDSLTLHSCLNKAYVMHIKHITAFLHLAALEHYVWGPFKAAKSPTESTEMQKPWH